jgi:hypothetical protein
MLRKPAFLRLPDLHDAYLAGGNVILAGRNSGETGKRPIRDAINDLLNAAKALATHGPDVRPALPSKVQMQEDLRLAPPVKSTGANGIGFTNRFVEYDLTGSHGVIVVVSTGSARKLDANGIQPFVAHMARTITLHNGVLVFGKRIDRLSRNAWALGPLMIALGKGWIGDEMRGIRFAAGVESLLVFFEAHAGEEEATKMVRKGQVGMVDATEREMVNGRSRMGLGFPPPPGFGSFRVRAKNGKGDYNIYLDDPRWAPAPEEAAYGLSEVTLDGRPVSQVDNVRFVLSHLGRPRWDYKQCAVELRRRGYSTVSLRRYNGPAATFESGSPIDIIGAIVANLDVYSSGEWTVTRDADDDTPVTITGCVHPDGPWATPEDLVRVNTYVNDGQMRVDGRIRLLLSGMHVTANGATGVLAAADRRPRTSMPTHYRIVQLFPSGKRGDAIPGAPLVEARRINTALIEAIAAAGDAAFNLVPDWAEAPSDDDAAAVAAALAALNELTTLKAQLKEDVRHVTGALLTDLNADYNELVTTKIPEAERALAAAEARASRTTATSPQPGGVAPAQFLDLVETLRDPSDTAYTVVVKNALEAPNINYTTTSDGTSFTFSARLRAGTATHQATLPVHETWLEAGGPTVDTDIEILIDALAEGTPYCEQVGISRMNLQTDVAAALNLPRSQCVFLNCLDPRILRAGMAVTLRRGDRTNEQIAADLDEPVALIERVDRQWNAPRSRTQWMLTGAAPYKSLLHTMAASAGGLVTYEQALAAGIAYQYFQDRCRRDENWSAEPGVGHRLKACPTCGGHARPLLRIREPNGPVCATCRTDNSGVTWPANPYDSYLYHQDRWVKLGFTTDTTPAKSWSTNWGRRTETKLRARYGTDHLPPGQATDVAVDEQVPVVKSDEALSAMSTP